MLYTFKIRKEICLFKYIVLLDLSRKLNFHVISPMAAIASEINLKSTNWFVKEMAFCFPAIFYISDFQEV